MTYEYLASSHTKMSDGVLEHWLNRMATDRWRLVAVEKRDDDWTRYIFERAVALEVEA